ncbi:response regulator transcription factor [Anaerocolumna xylanovorans]|uniref:Stage 0 sporulation protein A homolog n=1 Tax=Anaerocolumna xylanovorans DSM 12503 TaxID=1121345 RepID=A0A1M7XVZ0_9FIRM|nr:response regulator transcription factor [Anaerocolumna xylanovorans]SHO42893.1 two-component system, OmpR family, response regulator VicR [Anaerocolumna xylanovorans DSM 12503]
MKKILVIDDEIAIRDLIELVLKRENYQVKTAENGAIGLMEIDAFHPDLVLLDLMLPDYSGYDLCREIVKKSTIPIIMLSAKNETIDKVLGLELGAEDYMTKPFDNRELIARIKVVLRRHEPSDQIKTDKMEPIVCGELEIDLETKRVLKEGNQISLTAKEFKILETLSKRPKKIFTRDELLEIVWGYDYLGDSRSVDMTIMRLRKKLEDDSENPRYVRTIYGFGYQFGGDSL